MKEGKFQKQAADAAERIDAAQQVGQQLSFLADPDGDGGAMVPEAPRGAGRPKGSKNKTDAKMRDMLAAKGYRMPEDVLAEIAGLSSREDVFILAMARTEQLLVWAAAGAAEVGKKGHKSAWVPSGALRVAVFADLYKSQIKALEALLPYGLGKVTPDTTTHVQSTTIVMPGASAPASPGDGARLVSGSGDADLAPPPMPVKMQQNQQVENLRTAKSDGGSRTE